MPVGAMIFLGVVLAVFTVLDIFMLVTLLKPGDERNQIIVWKASSFTLLGVVGANILGSTSIVGVEKKQIISSSVGRIPGTAFMRGKTGCVF